MKPPRLARLGLVLAVLTSAGALRAQPSANDFNTRGSRDRQKGDWDAAIADFTKAIELKPGFAVAYNNRGGAKLAKQDFDGAIADFTKALELDPKHPSAAHNLSVARDLKVAFDRSEEDRSRRQIDEASRAGKP